MNGDIQIDHGHVNFHEFFGENKLAGVSFRDGIQISSEWIENWKKLQLVTEMTQRLFRNPRDIENKMGLKPGELSILPPKTRFIGESDGEIVLKAGAALMPTEDGLPSPGSCWIWTLGSYSAQTMLFMPNIDSLQVDYALVGGHREVFSGSDAENYLLGADGSMVLKDHLQFKLWTKEDVYDWVRWTFFSSKGVDIAKDGISPNDFIPPFDFERYLP